MSALRARTTTHPRRRTGARRRVLIAGGGIAALEALLAVHDLAGEHVALTLLSREREFAYRPMATAEPFGRGHAERIRLAEVAFDAAAELVHGELAAVDCAGRVAITRSGERIGYDELLVAIGASREPALRRALTWTPDGDAAVFGGLLRDLEEGYVKQVAFVVPPDVEWSLPAYELALMTAREVWGMGQSDVELTVYTHEATPLGLVGSRVTAELRRDLRAAGVRVRTGVCLEEDPQPPHRLILRPSGRELTTAAIVALPRPVGPRLAWLPSDASGFLRTDRHGKVVGVEGVWAAGDAVAFPIKQGGVAAQQADAAAEAIAHAVGVDLEPRPFRPVLRARFSGRYLSPYLSLLAGADQGDRAMRLGGRPVVAL